MASALTILLLGCWLAGCSRVSGGGNDLTQPGQTSAPTHPSSTEPEGTHTTQPGQMSTSTHRSSTETEETRTIQPGQTSTSTHPSNTETGGSGQSIPTSTGVSAAVVILLLLLLLLVAFVCFRKIRARRGSALRPSSTSPMGALKALAQQDTIYTSIDEGKKPKTPEPDSGADGLTYAELDGQALQGQRGGQAPAPEPAQTSEYAVINVSQGTPQ